MYLQHLRRIKMYKTRCIRGHELSGANIHAVTKRSYLIRKCRVCARDWMRARRQQQRARLETAGIPKKIGGAKPRALLDRLLAKIEFTETCWLWTGAKDPHGYGRIGAGGHYGRTLLAHKALYEICNGPVPPELCLDHLCRNPSCVSPDHLEVVTLKENLARGYGIAANYARRAHCKLGHPLMPAGKKIRRCRICHAAEELRRHHARKSRCSELGEV